MGTAANCGAAQPNALGYVVGLTVSEEAVHTPFLVLDERISSKLQTAIVVLVVLVAGGLFFVSFMAHRIARSTAKPVINLLRLMFAVPDPRTKDAPKQTSQSGEHAGLMTGHSSSFAGSSG